MKVTILTLLFAFILVVASVINYSFFVHAAADAQSLNGQPKSIITPNELIAGQNGQPWLWLLPLLSLPLLFFPLSPKVTEDIEDDDFNYWPTEVKNLPPYKTYAMGLKGGKTRKGKTSRRK